jgi:hypothetical protein
MVELPDHPWFLGCQFHPEYKSKPTEPHPLFVSYIAAALAHHLNKAEREARGEDPVGDKVAAVTGRRQAETEAEEEPVTVRGGSANGGAGRPVAVEAKAAEADG